jgi:hypothetical protein
MSIKIFIDLATMLFYVTATNEILLLDKEKIY